MHKIQAGQKFGLLTIVKESERIIKNKTYGGRLIRRVFLCECECGTRKNIMLISLMAGHTKSCGCLGVKNTDQTKHGLYKHPLNHIWASMRQRCNNSNNQAYHRYGGRGIKVCSEWDDFKFFYDWAIKNGWRKGLQVDRKDNNGNYSPDNCRIVTSKVNSNNRRDNVIVSLDGENIPLGLACSKFGLNLETVRQYLKRNHTFKDAIIHYGKI